MPSLDDIQTVLRTELPHLRERFNVETLGVFGSFVRGEQTERSDLDVLVTFSRTPTLFEIARLEHYLEDRLGIKVDVVLKEGLKPYVAPYVLGEVRYV